MCRLVSLHKARKLEEKWLNVENNPEQDKIKQALKNKKLIDCFTVS